MRTRSTSGALRVVGVFSGMATLLSALISTLAGSVGLAVDWPYQLPVALASVMATLVPALS
ncbi:hypothetical protein D3C81_2208710 [compost metagenome]